MPILIILMMLLAGKQAIYYGSTPADETVRRFLNISLTDSIDFIRWKLELQDDQYIVSCAYGLCQPGTSGFSNEKRVNMQGKFVKQGTYYALQYNDRLLRVMKINSSLMHIMNGKSMLTGNGGWSYTLNRAGGIVSSQCSTTAGAIAVTTAFQGRTPCQSLSTSPTCRKKKWYLILVIDPATKQPSHYLMGGRQYKQETMRRGHWAIERRADGRYIYKLDPEKEETAIRLLQADENILLFTDAKGNLLVGNENFSYTLSKTYIR